MKSFTAVNKKDLVIKRLERAETIPSRWYTDPASHSADNGAIHSTTWQYVGHTSQVEGPGDYLLGTAAGNPLIVVRGKDNILRAFFNVCRHRGGPLAIEERGNCGILQCKYHGWTYLLEGSLRGTPRFDRTELFDKKDFGLIPVHVDSWEGLLFVHLAKKREPLASVMDGIRERIGAHSLRTKKICRRVTYEVNCNWKVYVDNYLEGYHLPFVHPELCDLLDYQKYVTETYGHYSLQYSPFTGRGNVYTSGEGEAYYYFVFPNFMMNILPGRLQTNLVLPLAHNRCRVVFDYYYDDIASQEALRRIEDDIAYSDRVQHEDIEICELVQRGLESVAYDTGRFSPEMEEGVYHFQCLLKKAYKRSLTSRGNVARKP